MIFRICGCKKLRPLLCYSPEFGLIPLKKSLQFNLLKAIRGSLAGSIERFKGN
jgi:hypothetical protein